MTAELYRGDFDYECVDTDMPPEYTLLYQCVIQAINDYKGSNLLDFMSAATWLFDDCNWGYFSFVGTCEVLGFDVDVIRKYLLEWDGQRTATIRTHRRA